MEVIARRPRAAQELRLLQLLQATRVPAPTPRSADADVLIVERIDGEGPGPDEPGLLSQLAAALAEIQRVDADVSFLPERSAARNERVLLHGDFWPGDTLWRDGRLVAVIDW